MLWVPGQVPAGCRVLTWTRKPYSSVGTFLQWPPTCNRARAVPAVLPFPYTPPAASGAPEVLGCPQHPPGGTRPHQGRAACPDATRLGVGEGEGEQSEPRAGVGTHQDVEGGDTCLGAGGVAENLPLGVLHRAGHGAVHQAVDAHLGRAQLALQHRVWDDGEAGRPAGRGPGGCLSPSPSSDGSFPPSSSFPINLALNLCLSAGFWELPLSSAASEVKMGKLRHGDRGARVPGEDDGAWDPGDTAGTLLGDGGEDAEACSKLLDGATRLEPTVPLLLLGLQEVIAEVFPLLGCEHAQDPAREVAWVPQQGASTQGCFGQAGGVLLGTPLPPSSSSPEPSDNPILGL